VCDEDFVVNADQRLERLFHGLSNYERTRTLTKPWSLATMRALLEAAQVGESLPGTWVQVGGSKGKGTTVFYLESMARAAGLSTGVFVSPHLHHVTERVLLDGRPVGADRLAKAMEHVLALARDRDLDPSFFEAMTAAAVLVFRDARCQLVALEVGLGGRLDSTTAVPVDAAILTTIELEHVDLLGDTIEAIATEKAHIMRAGKPCWVRPDPASDPVFTNHAAAVGAVLMPVARIEKEQDEIAAWRGELRIGEATRRFRVAGASRFELPALALAYSCLRHLFPDADLALDPVRRPDLPGRFEVATASDGWPFVLDGAHTPASSAQVAAELCRRFRHQPVVVLYATAAGKLWQGGLSELLPLVDRFFVTALQGTEGVDPAVVVDWLGGQGKAAMVVDGPATGFSELSRCDAVRLVVGSFYLVGAVRSLIQEQ
jgi:dihydrofolate synthase / folylpolyglutamate synthase